MSKMLIAVGAVLAVLVVPSSALAWSGAHWEKNTCGADLVSPKFNGNWWIRVSDESGVLAQSSAIPAKSYPESNPLTVGGFSHDAGVHVVTYEAANAANHSDGYIVFHQTQWNCTASLQGRPGPPGVPGQPGIGYDCTGAAVPPGQTPSTCPGTPGTSPPPATCTSNRVYRVKVGDRFRGEKIHSARLTWANGKRHTNAVRRSDGRLHAVVSFRRVVSPLRGLWTIRLNITFDGGKHATLTRLVRLCSPDDSNLNFATDVHRDGA